MWITFLLAVVAIPERTANESPSFASIGNASAIKQFARPQLETISTVTILEKWDEVVRLAISAG